MCYDIAYLTKKKEFYEQRFDASFLDGVTPVPTYHATGFDHFDVPVITNWEPGNIQMYSWGLIPWWSKDPEKAVKLSHQTLNARGEELFQKSSFKDAAANKRCLILVDGFYEHHHLQGKTYPYFIRMKSGDSFALAGLWDKWNHKPSGLIRYTTSIVTTEGNSLLERIHNNPSLDGPRMPFILPKDMEKVWLGEDLEPKEVTDMVRSYDDSKMESFTVPRLRGKQAVGNDLKAMQPVQYQELISSQGSLF